MTPAGHLSVSYLVSRFFPRDTRMGCLLGGIAPDVDFFLLPFPFFNALHRVVSHNVFFVSIVAGLCAWFASKHRWKWFAGVFLCGLLHLFIDSILDDNPSNGLGAAIFWPLSDWMFQPFNLLSPDANPHGWNDIPHAVWNAFGVMMYEIPFYFAAGVLYWRDKTMPNSDGSSSPSK